MRTRRRLLFSRAHIVFGLTLSCALIFVFKAIGAPATEAAPTASATPSAQAIPAPDEESVYQRIEQLQRQVDELQELQFELYARAAEGRGNVRTFFDEAISFGGFFENAVTGIAGPDTDPQISANSHVLGLNVAVDFRPNLHFVSQITTGLLYGLQNPQNDARLVPMRRTFDSLVFGSAVNQAYTEFKINVRFDVQVGLGYVPFGRAFQEREAVLFRRRGGPQMIQSWSPNSVGVAFPLWMGAHIRGEFELGRRQWGYNAYTFSPTARMGSLGGGGRLWLQSAERVLTGISVQSGTEERGSYLSHGLDLEYALERSGVLLEYGKSVLSDGSTSAASYYIEPYFNFASDKWIVYLVADHLDHRTNTSVVNGTLQADPYAQWRLGGGLNWLPVQQARFRIGLLKHRYTKGSELSDGQRRDYYSLDLSAGVTF